MKQFLILFFALALSVSAKAQDKQTKYFYVVSTGVVDGSKKAIVTGVQSIKCYPRNMSSTQSTAIKNQFNDHKRARYSKYYDYYTIVFDTYNSYAEAANARRKYIGNKKSDNYTVVEDKKFTFYCDR